jgi:putative acyl-CoA dehydrogenase
MMKNVLADLALESEAATALALRLARAVDRTENGQDADGHEAVMRRVLTPIAKFWICKRGSPSPRRRWNAWAATAMSRSRARA